MDEIIYIVEDDEGIRELYEGAFEGVFATKMFENGKDFFREFTKTRPSLIILDIMLPDMDGYTILTKIREMDEKIPVIIVSAKSDEISAVKGLNKGADDYMTKPFSPSELVARVKSHIQRYQRLVGSRERPRPEILKIRGLEIDREARRVWVNGREKNMTGREYDLLLFLAEHPDTVYSKDRLFDAVWGVENLGDVSTVTVHIKHIRDKIEIDPENIQYIETVWGVGYRFRG